MSNRRQSILRPPYGTDPEPSHARNYSPRVQHNDDHPVSSRGPSRIDLLEERLAAQERSTHEALDRAFKIKEDVIDSLNFTNGTWQEEKHARAMLQEHIRTIMTVVNRLNSDIASLEEQIRSRDQAAAGTNSAMKNLEVHHVASLTDLRGRIVRCDTSISKLASELRNISDTMKQVSQQQQDSQNRVMERIHGLESKLIGIGNQLERNSSEQKMKLQHLEGDHGQQMSILDARTRQVIDDLKNSVTTFQANAESEREKVEARLEGVIEKHAQIRDSLVEKLERKIDEQHYVLETKIGKLEEGLMEERQRLVEMQQHIETKVIGRLDANLRQQQDEISKIKRETRDGFSTVHESISNMKTVMDGKRKLLEEQLRKEISQLRKMVVLV
ncbi:hypothetical protein CHS0354_018181 [Potamilus streckersoni]|uniref:Protein FAM81A n=1 Tax=Potamilus streckersoni TaxID=2493646 RepID=A0AAE0SAG3_9BIVA|nr:hypothetical protein CHS0354_018181 [Potamilus streckersoni]